jgi:hypothetical protein
LLAGESSDVYMVAVVQVAVQYEVVQLARLDILQEERMFARITASTSNLWGFLFPLPYQYRFSGATSPSKQRCA